ncbi:hypothetical protein DFR67_104114 [Williamsia limnetica]|uniref:Uncharacterized protein n=1 Tax=Williamsia limnetica TaxID=882452 RepID=A0A318S3S5_WILLI|nr:hypothetical protein DFR67_104114 [Williamsia limnetica]
MTAVIKLPNAFESVVISSSATCSSSDITAATTGASPDSSSTASTTDIFSAADNAAGSPITPSAIEPVQPLPSSSRVTARTDR